MTLPAADHAARANARRSVTVISEEDKIFLADHRFLVMGVERREGPPALSPLYYVMQGDQLLISTRATRAKTASLRRNPEVSVCVLGEDPAHPYVTIFGTAQIDETGGLDALIYIHEVTHGRPPTDAERTQLEEKAHTERRIALRITPESSFHSPTGHPVQRERSR
jgi:PPOX class probable F420-dependent enzyme